MPSESAGQRSPEDPIRSVEGFIAEVEDAYSEWDTDQRPWFRGEPFYIDTPLLPSVFRDDHDENALLQYFRMRGPAMLDLPEVPARGAIDLWLFLARHMGLPTRLLDWTEGALIALWFALQTGEEPSVVWMLDRRELNRKSVEESEDDVDLVANQPTLAWFNPEDSHHINIYYQNIEAAWRGEDAALPYPVGIQPTHIHGLMSAQHSCFTVHGSEHRGIHKMVGEDCLRRFQIEMPAEDRKDALAELRRLGISRQVVFPSGRGLAEDLAERF